jgi:OPT family oligopeptide transporter
VVFLHILCVHHSPSPKCTCVLTSFTVVTFTFGVIVIEMWDTQLSIWALVLSLTICKLVQCSFLSIACLLKFFQLAFTFTIPNGVIAAMSNKFVYPNVITELIIGYALPHHPIAMMMFKTWGIMAMGQALVFTCFLKLGHYMKVPHRPMFFSLVIGIIVSSTVQLAVQTWMFDHIKDLCGSNQKDNFTCPRANTFGSASIIVSPILDGHFSHLFMYS